MLAFRQHFQFCHPLEEFVLWLNSTCLVSSPKAVISDWENNLLYSWLLDRLMCSWSLIKACYGFVSKIKSLHCTQNCSTNKIYEKYTVWDRKKSAPAFILFCFVYFYLWLLVVLLFLLLLVIFFIETDRWSSIGVLTLFCFASYFFSDQVKVIYLHFKK